MGSPAPKLQELVAVSFIESRRRSSPPSGLGGSLDEAASRS